MLASSLLRACFYATFAAVLALAAEAQAQAQPRTQPAAQTVGRPDPFTVSDISVDASADSAAAARPLAIAEGERRAFGILLRRLTQPEDHGRLPRASEALLNDVIAGFGIDEERASATRYIAKISVTFRADAVRRLLQDNRIAYAETMSRPVLVVPVWQGQAGLRIWESDNPWRAALTQRPDTQGGLVPLRIAPASDAGGPSLERLLGNAAELQGQARAAGLEDALAVVATLQSADPGPGSNPVRIDIATQHQGGALFLAGLEPFTATGGTQEEALLSAAVELARRIEARWKQGSVIDMEKQGRISVAAGFRSLAEWNRLRAALGALPIVRKVDVLQVSHRDAQILLEFFGEPEQLRVALAQRDVVLQQRDGFWDMRSRQ